MKTKKKQVKNIILYIGSCLIFILLIFFIFDSNNNVTNKGEVTLNYTTQDINKTGIKEAYMLQSVDESVCNFSQFDQQSIQNVLQQLPDRVYQLIQFNEWSYQVETAENMHLIAKRNGYDLDLNGLTIYQTKKVYVVNTDEEAILHETGHVLDYILEFPSKENDFQQIHKAEKQLFSDTYYSVPENIETESEYFAESFAKYVSNPLLLQKKCPKTYQYLDTLISNL